MLYPEESALDAIAANPSDKPVVMLNLLKFKPEGGRESYQRYGEAVTPLIEALGGSFVYAGLFAEMVTPSEDWDAIVLVRYPSRSTFVEMIRSEEYRKAHENREAALERAVWYATDPGRF